MRKAPDTPKRQTQFTCAKKTFILLDKFAVFNGEIANDKFEREERLNRRLLKEFKGLEHSG
jgi:hypothetical protein